MHVVKFWQVHGAQMVPVSHGDKIPSWVSAHSDRNDLEDRGRGSIWHFYFYPDFKCDVLSLFNLYYLSAMINDYVQNVKCDFL